MTSINIGHVGDAATAGSPSRPALVLQDGACTYGQLEHAVRQAMTSLFDTGVEPGDRVPIVDVGSVVSVAGTLAAARLGAAAALLNPALRPAEIEALIATAGCRRLAIAGDAYAEDVGAAVGGHVVTASDVMGATAASADSTVGADGDEALVLFTSGTTGLPKAVSISHGVLAGRLTGFAAPFNAETAANTTMMCVPYFHVGGSLGLLGALYSGSTIVIQDRFDAGAWIRLVRDNGVSGAFLVPTMLQRILDHPDCSAAQLSSLVSITYGAAAAPVALIERAMDALPHVAFANVFGQTETLGAYTMLLPGDHKRRERIGSLGKPLPGVEIRIVSPGTDDPVPPGEVGELLVLSPQNVSPGWLRTGDLARVDHDGYLYPSGRLSDTINRGGEKFGPIEIESVLRRHPTVEDVAVTGVADTEMGQRVAAAVVVRDGGTKEELTAFCRQHLAHFKVPERIVFVDNIPYNETGKVDRRALGDLVVAHVDKTP
ncbi:MAG TPA: fatty acid--CoA ligase family protein [Acidimicrobiales bacterium]